MPFDEFDMPPYDAVVANSPSNESIPTSGFYATLESLRPKQWTKNSLLYVALIFSANQAWTLSDPIYITNLFIKATIGFIIFCMLSSASYLVNDVVDIKRDQLHPQKRYRAIASKRLGIAKAIIISAFLVIIGLTAAALLNMWFFTVATTYTLLALAYTLKLKHIVVLDVTTLSGGFILRAIAGAIVIGVPISPWLYACTGLGSLFVGFGKRRNELAAAGSNIVQTRNSLARYSLSGLDRLAIITAVATLVAYILYTFTAENLQSNVLIKLTIPIVAYGLFRYSYLVKVKMLGEFPEEVFLTDAPLTLAIGLWLIMAITTLLTSNSTL
jgi:4-hydroxybenzoate polyprenyltransferase